MREKERVSVVCRRACLESRSGTLLGEEVVHLSGVSVGAGVGCECGCLLLFPL